MLEEILYKTFFSNKVLDYVIFLGVFIFGYIAIWVLKKIFYAYVNRSKTQTRLIKNLIIDLIHKIFFPISIWIIFFGSLQVLELHAKVNSFINVLNIIIVTFFGIRLIVEVLNYFMGRTIKERENFSLEKEFNGIVFIAKIVIWFGATLFILDNLGFNVSTLVAGLGIGGIAIGLAAQVILKDLFSYFSIILDKPFEIGDFIILDDFLGVVEHIGIKTTRIRSLGGEELIFSNTDLTDSRLRNYKRMEKRRVAFKLGVTYSTTTEKVKEIPVVIEGIIKNIENTVFDRAHFASYADSHLEFEIVYYILSSNYNEYMDVQQKINLGIKEEFERRNIEFAFPTYTIYKGN